MALQDLTPQLRTRLNRMERAVGWFVLLAVALMVVGFAYYLQNTAKRRGWFKKRVPYYTMVDRATGLHVGDPVMLMGFEVGQITEVTPMPPNYFDYNVYVEFAIIEPNYGYVWTKGSHTKIASDLFGKRVLEVTKGDGGHATYEFHPMEDLTLAAAERLTDPERWALAMDAYDSSGTNLVVPAGTAFNPETLQQLRRIGLEAFPALNLREELTKPTAVWDGKAGTYVTFVPKPNPKANLYWLPADESPAVSERAEKLIGQVEQALPDILNLTNKIGSVLDNSATLTSNLNLVALSAQPAASNLAHLAAELRGPGAFGEWALGTNGQQNLDSTLANVNTTIVHTDTNLTQLAESLAVSLNNLADITSNLNAQVQANTNMLGAISKAVVDTDELVQGLKKHWLFRSAFRDQTKKPAETPVVPLRSPKASGQQ